MPVEELRAVVAVEAFDGEGQRGLAGGPAQQPGRLLVGLVHLARVGEHHEVTPDQARRLSMAERDGELLVTLRATGKSPVATRRSATRCAPQPSVSPMDSASVRM